MDDQPRQKLCEIISEYSSAVCEEPKRLEGLLRDMCGSYKREIHVLMGALQERVVTDLLNADAKPQAVLLAKLSRRLYDNLGTAEEFAQWAVESWAVALGVVDHPVIRHTAPVEPYPRRDTDMSVPMSSTSSPLPTPTFNIQGVIQGTIESSLSVVFSPNGKLLALGGIDKVVRLWELASGCEIQWLEGHTAWVHCVVFSSDGQLLASASGDGTVQLWKTGSWRVARRLVGHTDQVLSVVFSPDGRLLASGSKDHTIRLWEASSGKMVRHLVGHTDQVVSIAFSPDGRWLASGSKDHTVWLWDVSSGKAAGPLIGHADWVLSVAFSPNGRLLVTGNQDQTVRMWEVPTGRTKGWLEGHTEPVSSVAFSPDGRLLASGSNDKTIRLWEIASGRVVQQLHGHMSEIRSVAFSPNGSMLASGGFGDVVRIWGLGMSNCEWERIEKAWHPEERKRVEQQRELWRNEGRCELCGELLGTWDKLLGNVRCKDHR